MQENAATPNTTQEALPNLGIPTQGPERVILLHGLASHRWIMHPLAKRLVREGYEAQSWGYPSLRGTVQSHANDLQSWLRKLDCDIALSQWHIIAHSMGGIVTRQALLDWRPNKLRKVIMLGPPNRGSHVARKLTPYLGNLCQTLSQLSDEPDSYVARLPQTITSIADVGIIRAGGDRVVAPTATRIDGAKDSATVPGMHTAMLFRKQTADLCLSFLRTGSFDAAKTYQTKL